MKHDEGGDEKLAEKTESAPRPLTFREKWHHVSINNKLIVFFTGVAALAAVAYSGLAVWQLIEIHSNATDTHMLAETTAKQLELSERPWVDTQIGLGGPLTWNANGATILLDFRLLNTGHSVAVGTVAGPLALVGFENIGYGEQQLYSNCGHVTRVKTRILPSLGQALFPGHPLNQDVRVTFFKAAIAKSSSVAGAGPGQMVFPFMITCVSYRPIFDEEIVYHTGYAVNLLRIDPSQPDHESITFKVGENVDIQHLRLQRSTMIPSVAN